MLCLCFMVDSYGNNVVLVYFLQKKKIYGLPYYEHVPSPNISLHYILYCLKLYYSRAITWVYVLLSQALLKMQLLSFSKVVHHALGS